MAGAPAAGKSVATSGAVPAVVTVTSSTMRRLTLAERVPLRAVTTRVADSLRASHPAIALRWTGETGHIRREFLVRHLPDLKSPMYYFAGPPAMTMAMRGMLQEIGVGEQAMRYEEFYGY